MPEGRQSPRHPWKKVWDAVFLGAAMPISKLHRLEAECRQGVLAARLGALSEGTMGYALQRQEPAQVFALGCGVARRLKRNGLLRSEGTRGRIVVAVDGIEICSSFVRCCDTCMERKVKHQVDGQLRQDLQYYHRIVAVVVVSTPFPIPLGIRFQKPGETEVACALALLRELDEQLGCRFFDVLVADALYLQRGFVKEVEALRREGVISLKENQPELRAEAQRLTDGPPQTPPATPPEEVQVWHAPEVYCPVADRSVRVVKTVRIQKRNRLPVRSEDCGKMLTHRVNPAQIMQSKKKVLVYDFWNDLFMGETEDEVTIAVPPRNVRSLCIVETAGVPQVLEVSDYLPQMGYGLSEVSWSEGGRTLRGQSAGASGDSYHIVFYVPTGYEPDRAIVDTKETPLVKQPKNLWVLPLTGKGKPVEWSVHFR